MFEPQAFAQGGLRYLELFRCRRARREPVLQLVSRLGQRARDGCVGMPDHPTEDLRRGGKRPEARKGACGAAQVNRRARGQDVADRRRHEQWADEMGPAALVFLPALLTVLVAPDRDVLGPVVGGQLRAAQGDRRGRSEEHTSELQSRVDLVCRLLLEKKKKKYKKTITTKKKKIWK